MHPRNAYIDICFHTVRADQVIGPDRGGQAIAVGINQRQQFLFAVERSDVAAQSRLSVEPRRLLPVPRAYPALRHPSPELPVLHDWHEIGLKLFTKTIATGA